MAWLHAVPDPPAVPEGMRPSPRDSRSRQKRMAAMGVPVSLPPNPWPAMVRHLLDIGPIISTGQGAVEVSWRDLAEWQRGAGLKLSPWRARLLRRLSREYLDELHLSRSPDRPAPWSDPRAEAVERALEADNLDAFFDSFGAEDDW